MKNTKHTPGPWQVIVARTMAHIHQNPRGSMIGSLDFVTAEQKANARLIAAAPQMLEALKAEVCSAGCPEWCCGKIRAAIKAAEGE